MLSTLGKRPRVEEVLHEPCGRDTHPYFELARSRLVQAKRVEDGEIEPRVEKEIRVRRREGYCCSCEKVQTKASNAVDCRCGHEPCPVCLQFPVSKVSSKIEQMEQVVRLLVTS